MSWLRRKLIEIRIAWTQGAIEERLKLLRVACARRDRLRASLEELNRRASHRRTQREINRIAKRRGPPGSIPHPRPRMAVVKEDLQ